MLTLFHAPRSRSTRFIFLLEEIGVPYEIKVINIRRSDGSGAVDPDNPHPLGKVPALIHDDVTVFDRRRSFCTSQMRFQLPGSDLRQRTEGEAHTYLSCRTTAVCSNPPSYRNSSIRLYRAALQGGRQWKKRSPISKACCQMDPTCLVKSFRQ